MRTNDPLLILLSSEGRLSEEELAERLGISSDEVARRLVALEDDGSIVGYQVVLNPEKFEKVGVSAFIEVRLTPERGGGFDRVASRIARFPQVSSCYLSSGGYDLMVIVEGEDLREVASFVSEKLSTIGGVLSTATHFRLKTYKECGFMVADEEGTERLEVTP